MPNGISRRRLLQWATGTAVVLAVDPYAISRGGTGQAVTSLGSRLRIESAPALSARLLRASDQLDLFVEFFDVTVVGDLVVPSGPDPLMRLSFGPQHLGENVFLAGDVPTGATEAIVAANTTVVVPVSGPVDLTLDALIIAASTIRNVDDDLTLDGTATELALPASLVLSPAAPAGITASSGPLTVDGVSEVWSARVEPNDAGDALTLRVVANVDPTDTPALRLPDADSRDALVTNTTTDTPLSASRLWLSSAGAFTDLHGAWTADLASYEHQIVSGRDVSVTVSSLGYLLPFGHRAAIVDVGRRTFVDGADGGVAIVQVERFLTVVEATVSGRTGAPDDGRGLPFVRVDVVGSDARPIAEVAVVDLGGATISGASDIALAVDGSDVVVDYQATDRSGGLVSFSFPATFVDDSIAYGTAPGSPIGRLRAVTNAPARQPRREAQLGGQDVAFADPTGDPASTTKSTTAIRLAFAAPTPEADEAALSASQSPASFGTIEHADILDDLVGGVSGATGQSIGVTMHPRWIAEGNGPGNFDLAFLTLDVPAVGSLGEGVVASIASIELVAEVFNQSSGIGPDLDLPTSPWNPATALGELSRIIGNIALLDLVDPIAAIEDAIPGIDIPGTTVNVDEDGTVTVEFCWMPTLRSLPVAGFVADKNTTCTIKVTTTVSASDEVDPLVATVMEVSDFDLAFPPGLDTPLVVVSFDRITARVDSTGASSVTPVIERWDFGGTISALQALVESLGIGDLDFQIVGSIVELENTVQFPSISLGVLEVKNLGLATGLDLPIGDGNGLVTIGIGSKGKPVELEVLMFGGTFWLDVQIGFGSGQLPVPIISVGVSVFWEVIDLDIIVASATLTLRLSADFRFEGDDVRFTGALSLEGEVSLLGLVEASVTVSCSLTYDSAAEDMVLKGTVAYRVDTFLGKIGEGSVPIGRTTIPIGDGEAPQGIRRVAQRATGPSSFADRYNEPAWVDYCDAFA